MSDSSNTAGEVVAETTPTEAASVPEPKSNEDHYWRRQAEKHEKRARELERAQMSEAERIKAERDEARAEAQAAREQLSQTLMQTRFEAEANKLGCLDPEAAFALADRSLLQMQDGKPVGIGKALKALAEAKPYLFQRQPQPRRSSGGNPPDGNGGGSINQRMNDLLRGLR